MTLESDAELKEKTIRDFEEQWNYFHENYGYYGSSASLKDVMGPLMDFSFIRGKRVAEIGSGTGRIVHMLLEAEAAHVWALEPSPAVEGIRRILGENRRVSILQKEGDAIPSELQLDLILSIGVIHHIPDPLSVLQAIWQSLRPGGQCLIWVYGCEGNQLYIAAARLLRIFTTRMSHRDLKIWSQRLVSLSRCYIFLNRFIPLPLQRYIQNVFLRLSPEQRTLVIYDQLNPAYVKYYKQSDLRSLLEKSGFSEVRLYHHLGYSWTAIGRKPLEESR